MGSFNPLTGEYQEGPMLYKDEGWPPPAAFFEGFGGARNEIVDAANPAATRVMDIPAAPPTPIPPPVPMGPPPGLAEYLNDFSQLQGTSPASQQSIAPLGLPPPASGFNPAAFSHPGAPAYNPTAFTPKEPPPEGGFLTQGQSRLEDINKQREADQKNLANWGDAGGGAYVPPQYRYGGGGGDKVSEVKSSSYTALPADVKKGFKESIQGVREASRRQQEAQDEIGIANERAAKESAELMTWERWNGKIATHDHEEAKKRINGALAEQEMKMNEAVEAVRNSKINKNRFMDEAGAGNKAMMGVGLLLASLSKIGSIGRVGQKRPESRVLEFSMEQINNAVDRDIRVQQMEHEQKKDKAALEGNLYSQLRQRGVDQEVAFDLARSRGLKEMRLGLERIATNLQSETSKASAELLKAKTAEAEQKTLFDAYAKRGQLEGVQINKQRTTVSGGGGAYQGVPKNLQLTQDDRKAIVGSYAVTKAYKELYNIYKRSTGYENFGAFWDELPGRDKDKIRRLNMVLATKEAKAAGATPISNVDVTNFAKSHGSSYASKEDIKELFLINLRAVEDNIKGLQMANPDKDLTPTLQIQKEIGGMHEQIATDPWGNRKKER